MILSNTQSPFIAIANEVFDLDVSNITNSQINREIEPESSTFIALGLSPEIVSALIAAGYKTPTPVQQRAIPAGIAGRDLLVSSPTGSGKTAAFMLPAIERFAQLEKVQTERLRTQHTTGLYRGGGRRARQRTEPQQVARPSLLVLTPTRELAMQVTTAAAAYGKHLRRLRTVSILGGVAYGQQLMLLAKNPEILVATPGRLIDHLERGRIDLSELQILVLDEADRMLDMGFIEDIETIVATTPSTRQTMLFSATLDGKIGSLTHSLLKNPERIRITHCIEARANIAQTVHYVDDRNHKDRLLDHLLRDAGLDQAIVFTATKLEADQLAGRLADAGFQTAALHGNLPQGIRNRTIRALRERRVRVLVATDVAARGIDIPGVTHVFNYDLPKFAEDYMHRIGRTGRAGRSGVAVSLVHHAEQGVLKRIEHFVRFSLPVNVIEGFEPRKTPPANRGFGAFRRPGRDNSMRHYSRNGKSGNNYGHSNQRNSSRIVGQVSESGSRDSMHQQREGYDTRAGHRRDGQQREEGYRNLRDYGTMPSRKGYRRSRNSVYNSATRRYDGVHNARRDD